MVVIISLVDLFLLQESDELSVSTEHAYGIGVHFSVKHHKLLHHIHRCIWYTHTHTTERERERERERGAFLVVLFRAGSSQEEGWGGAGGGVQN